WNWPEIPWSYDDRAEQHQDPSIASTHDLADSTSSLNLTALQTGLPPITSDPDLSGNGNRDADFTG
ncbi:hypothetical protein, partial [Methylotetracoccus oryzae]|uniref:hypothetical protein n=1 Tax=Methylotetracoccus oryzae TaxID=1919059 RepID=UPI001F293391